VIGETGTGKSSLCNVIAGKPATSDFFPVGHELDSKTWETTVNPAKWKGDGFDIEIIDTPGLDDPNGPQKDDENIAEMIKKLKKLDHVHLFFVIFNGEVPRLSRTLMELLKIFRDMFGPHFLMNTVFGFSRWSFDKRAIKTRQQQQKTEASLTEDLNNKLRENGFQLRKDVPAVFIDSMYDDECSKEKEEFVQNMKRLSVHAQTMDPFPCSQFQEGVQRDITNAKKAEEEAKHAKEKAEEELKVAEEKAKRLKEKAEEEKRKADKAEEKARNDAAKAKDDKKRDDEIAKIHTERLQAEIRHKEETAKHFKEKAEEEKGKADKAEEKARNDAAKARDDKKRDDEIAKINIERLQAEMRQKENHENKQRLMDLGTHKRELDDNYRVNFQLTLENCTTKHLDPQGITVKSGLVSRGVRDN